MPLIQIVSMLLYVTAAFCVFLMMLNRVFILLRDSRAKAPLILATFVAFIASGVILGFFFARPPWVYVPVAVLALVAIGEMRRSYIRRSCAGSPPVDTIPHRVNLTTPLTTTDLVVHRYRLSHPKWHGAPLRIAHLTDLHVHPSIPLEYYQDVVAAAEQTEPDIAVFTGDFITSLDALPKLAKVLRPIGKMDTFAVLGNHDYWADADAVRGVITESGLRLLSDETAVLAAGNAQLAVTGYDYPWGAKRKSIPNQTGDTLHLVLSHTPDNIYRLSESSADIVFSGHCHAGQIRAPMVGSIIVPSVYGRRFDHGHFVIEDTHLFVASGIGAADPAVRIYCQPDVFIVEIGQEQDG